MKHADDGLKQILGATPECLAPERLSETLTEPERRHLEGCLRCQSELRLWQEFERSEPLPDEGAAVQWIVAELSRRNARASAVTVQKRGWLLVPLRGWATALATLALAAGIGYALWDREPTVREPQAASDTYRTERLDVVGPVGDVRTAPDALAWVAIPNAIDYDIEVFEVDETPLWRATSKDTRIDLPPAVVRQLAPGKTVLWQVRARNAGNAVIAESGRQQFRVQVTR